MDQVTAEQVERIDWAASCRLALVVSLVAAVAALLLAGALGETAVVVSVIVAGTAASWFHLEQGRLTRPVRTATSVTGDPLLR